ncbi:mannosylglycerate hydrolase [Enterococcus rivorum]|uniref:Alpha-mannosidase n=1 Tax=Enterococcus rivorum TaxID=762845 RepID=A0A1E5L0H1_9ENTE|nr:mannosylglycerate hydrolase [Enterococcus rivorum]MBP2100148.1 mannosylglycerate hydrolase [Enterococcus rivorum]OEH83409.1 alpha-mannosidase [Enterococcus rivorum]
MKKIVHVVPHSHWDREWYFTTSRSKVYLMHDVKKVLEQLEADNGYETFILDGQASLLDDYLKWRPQDRKRIEALVHEGKLIIGPWYTQTDQLVISGESIVRNLLYGMAICETIGSYMNIGYVPDSFGQAASMPQIYRGFGIEDTMFWRGVSDDEVKQTEFKWRGEDGSVVTAFQIPSGYYIGGAIPEKEEALAKFLYEEPFKTTWGRSSTNHVYFPNGFDQAPVRKNLPELVGKMNRLYQEDYELHFSTIEKYIQAVKKQQPELEEVTGELTNGKLMRIHKTIFSSRSDLKVLNTQVQNYLVNVMEPILTISMTLGFEYPVETVKEIWKLMFENAAHDSIGSCVSDTTNEDIYMRYKQARDIAINLVELTMREIATQINNAAAKEMTLTVFNPASQSRAGVIEAEVYLPQKEFAILDEKGQELPYTILERIDQTEYVLNQGNILNPTKEMYLPEKVYKAKIAFEASVIPSVGYTQLTIDLSGNTLQEIVEHNVNQIENEFYQLTIHSNGLFDILDKLSGTLYKEQGIIEENGDNGDSFNYSPPEQDLLVYATDFVPNIEVKESALLKSVKVSYQMKVPANLEERKRGQATALFPVSLNVTLKKGSQVIDFSLQADNRFVDSHRVCLLFNTGIQSKVSTADQQFGTLQRPVVYEKEMALWTQHKDQWNEMPIAIETCQSFVSLFDNQKGVSLMPKGVREYEVVGEKKDTIRLTIFRTYGFMGKENLFYRPGRASGETVVETPAAQCHKEMTFELSVYYFSGSFNQAEVANIAKQANTPVQVYQVAEFLNSRLNFTLGDEVKELPVSYSLFEMQGEMTLSVVKKAESQAGYIIRVYNGHMKEKLDEVIRFKHPVKIVKEVNLKEEMIRELQVHHQAVAFSGIGHAKFLTLYVE